MRSLLIHAALGLLTVGVFFFVNAHLYRRDWPGSRTTLLEGVYYALAVISVCAGWFFNVRYVFAYPEEASWTHFTRMLFANARGGLGRPGSDHHQRLPLPAVDDDRRAPARPQGHVDLLHDEPVHELRLRDGDVSGRAGAAGALARRRARMIGGAR